MSKATRLTCAIALVVVTLQACVSPQVVHYYDEECQAVKRKIVLIEPNAGAFELCESNSCRESVVGGLVLLGASTVISGSIALIGNTVYWLERKATCKGSPKAQT